MLSAQDRDQVLKWSQRQLGSNAKLVSISESDVTEETGLIEKGGTGITAREAVGCQPVLSIMADLGQRVQGVETGHPEHDACVNRARFAIRVPTAH